VNVVVQTLWNVAAFREAFAAGRLRPGVSEADRSIFIALKEVCSMMEVFSTGGGTQPKQASASGLKEALYRLNSKFELGEMHDAAEAHEALLDALHRATAESSLEHSRNTGIATEAKTDASGRSHIGATGLVDNLALGPGLVNGYSFVKHIFSMKMRMSYADPIDPTEEPSKPMNFEQWTQYVLASELRSAVRENDGREGGDDHNTTERPMLRVLRKEAGKEAADAQPRRTIAMLRAPQVFTLGLASETARASKTEIRETFDGVDEILNLGDVYDGLPRDAHCELVALTAFYEQHYTCFCRSATGWLHYDDDVCKVVGRDFDDVRQKCVSGRLHPVLLFYQLTVQPAQGDNS